ncbi:hypothetical protein LA080_013181 [Diaporthe eres]|nr:hypothetical protein LA080_013181 [Diaporthe eres]
MNEIAGLAEICARRKGRILSGAWLRLVGSRFNMTGPEVRFARSGGGLDKQEKRRWTGDTVVATILCLREYLQSWEVLGASSKCCQCDSSKVSSKHTSGQQLSGAQLFCDGLRGSRTDRGRMGHQFTTNLKKPDGAVMFAKRPNPTAVSSQSRAGFLVGYRKERWDLQMRVGVPRPPAASSSGRRRSQ